MRVCASPASPRKSKSMDATSSRQSGGSSGSGMAVVAPEGVRVDRGAGADEHSHRRAFEWPSSDSTSARRERGCLRRKLGRAPCADTAGSITYSAASGGCAAGAAHRPAATVRRAADARVPAESLPFEGIPRTLRVPPRVVTWRAAESPTVVASQAPLRRSSRVVSRPRRRSGASLLRGRVNPRA